MLLFVSFEFSPLQAPTRISSRPRFQSSEATASAAPYCSSSTECAGDQSKSTGLGGGAVVSLKSRFVVRIVSDGEALRAAATASDERVRLMPVWSGAWEDIFILCVCVCCLLGFDLMD
jgi:hypothetical protein